MVDVVAKFATLTSSLVSALDNYRNGTMAYGAALSAFGTAASTAKSGIAGEMTSRATAQCTQAQADYKTQMNVSSLPYMFDTSIITVHASLIGATCDNKMSMLVDAMVKSAISSLNYMRDIGNPSIYEAQRRERVADPEQTVTRLISVLENGVYNDTLFYIAKKHNPIPHFLWASAQGSQVLTNSIYMARRSDVLASANPKLLLING